MAEVTEGEASHNAKLRHQVFSTFFFFFFLIVVTFCCSEEELNEVRDKLVCAMI